MNLPFFISRRISKPDEDTFSGTIHKVAVVSIALGLAVMIIAFFILLGFKGTIRDKIFSFNGHLLVSEYSLGTSYQEDPVSMEYEVYQHPENFQFIEHIQEFSHKPGLIKTKEEVDGVVLKGVGESFSLDRFAGNIREGQFITFKKDGFSNEVVISKKIANRLKLKVGDPFIIHFIQDPPRARRLDVVGIYETGLEDFDDRIILGDINVIRRLNGWDETTAGGFEIYLKDEDQLEEAFLFLYDNVESNLLIQKVTDKYIQIFDWLHLINNNVTIFLTLILFVASFNMVSIVLILIMERTQMIGILKAMGAADSMIRRIFRYQGMALIFKGLFFGNLVGLGLCFIQYRFQVIKLDQDSYYMSFVPIEWDWMVVLFLNLLIFLVVALVMILPTTAVSRMNPIKSIRFD